MFTIRGATTVEKNTEEEIRLRSLELYDEIVKINNLEPKDFESMIFTCTNDIDEAYPSKFVRKERNLDDCTFMNLGELNVKGSLRLCIRVLIFLNRNLENKVRHVYLHGAKDLKLK